MAQYEGDERVSDPAFLPVKANGNGNGPATPWQGGMPTANPYKRHAHDLQMSADLLQSLQFTAQAEADHFKRLSASYEAELQRLKPAGEPL